MRARLLVGLVGVVLVNLPANAQDLDAGKTPQQLFASNCSACHRSARGLAAGGGAGLVDFLRQHYTSSAATAASLASYLASVGSDPREADRRRRATRETQPPQRREPPANPRQEASAQQAGEQQAGE
ncbi:MAG: c-type cytochrome, partial [Variibacter sp.]|nr:c-type cytochrome [Variibacter sp.]